MFAFYNKATGNAIYLRVNNEVLAKNPQETKKIFSNITIEKINLDYLENNSKKWESIVQNKAFDGNEFSITGIANVWAQPQCTHDFLKAAQFHNHVCPGVNSGYL